MTTNTISRALSICRMDEEQRMVWGTAATEQEASDGMVLPMDALQDAWPDYMQFANVREMHADIAAGIVTEYTFTADNRLEVGVKVSDPVSWQKVKDGVLKGFSVCGEILELAGNVIRKLRLLEISLVDRPADPGALVTLFRAEGARNGQPKEGETPEGESSMTQTVKRDAGDISGQIAEQEGTPLDASLDVIGLLMSKFQDLASILEQLGSGANVHPDVLAHCMRAHQYMGRAIKSHIDGSTTYSKGSEESEPGANDGQGEPEDGIAKRAASILKARRAASHDPRVDDLVKGMSALTESVAALVKRSENPASTYQAVIAPQIPADSGKVEGEQPAAQVKRSDAFGPLEGTPEFDALSTEDKLHVALRRANPSHHTPKQ